MEQSIKIIEIILRAIIIYDGKILLCHSPENKPHYYYLPGGHLEKGETLKQCIQREMKEEINSKVKNIKFLALIENFFTDKRCNHHELNLVYKVDLNVKKPFSVKSQESHVYIKWLNVIKLTKIALLPINIQEFLIKNFTL